MKHCDKCNVNVKGNRTTCPLCQAVLSGETEGKEIFPVIPTIYTEHSLFFKILVFLSILAAVTSATINVILPQKGWWSLFVIAGIVCMWLIIFAAAKRRKNIIKNIFFQVVFISVLAILWDVLSGWNRWSVEFVIPILCVSATIAISIIAKVMNLYFEDYIVYVMLNALFSIISIILLLSGVIHIILPSLVCIAANIVSMSALMIFEGGSLIGELKRRLHL